MPEQPRHKVVRTPEFKEVVYDSGRWKLLKSLRSEALRIMEVLTRCGISPVVHGSVTRGDVSRRSDVDVVVPYVVQPYLVLTCIEGSGLNIYSKYIVQATPASTPKAYVELDPEGLKTVSFPLGHLSPREWEFYRFGGLLDVSELRKEKRVPGVNKSLRLIIPTKYGHKEAPVIGYEDFTARVIGISIETVLERVKVLTRRDAHGRTGVFLKYVLVGDENFEEAYRKLVKSGRIRSP